MSVQAQGYRHEALFYDHPDELVSWTAEFARQGLAAGEPVLLAFPRERLRAVRHELGPDAADVDLVDLTRLGRNPARITGVWPAFVDRHPGRPTRGMGEPAWAGRPAVELVECRHHESLLNVAVPASAPLWLVCPYDTRALDAATVEAARGTHPVVCEHGKRHPSSAYAPPGSDVLGDALPDPPAHATPVRFSSENAPSLRAAVRARALAEGIPASRADDLVLAVHEAAANAVHHGAGHGALRLWREGGHLVCEVRDRGTIGDPMLGRRAPGVGATGGRGLWMINQLCDLVQLRSGPDGTCVRLWVRAVPDLGRGVAA
jgi:anti-sigma regulatory factor (Ser/Thr protein kinase)